MKCYSIPTPAFTLQKFGDGTFRLFPPPVWTMQLAGLTADGTISHTIANQVCQIWRERTIAQINEGVRVLIRHGMVTDDAEARLEVLCSKLNKASWLTEEGRQLLVEVVALVWVSV
jgi:hypothetical protein